MKKNNSEIVETLLYSGNEGAVTVEVIIGDETIWANLNQLASLFGRDKSVISRHIKNILEDEELIEDLVIAKIATTAKDGKNYNVKYYNLDMIISVGYRVNSKQATQFRIWATNILKEYIIKKYTINRESSKSGTKYGKDYISDFDRFLEKNSESLFL